MSLRRLRLRAVWLLVVPFFWLARPTGAALAGGVALASAGLVLRAWAAGVIRKERELAVTGPYAHVRHPLYLGSLLLGVGMALAGGHWAWPVLFLAFYTWAYGRTMAAEEVLLEERFGERYRAWAAAVPALIPRLEGWREPGASAVTAAGALPAFSWRVYMRNREWEAALGLVAGLGVLLAKWGLARG